MSDTDTDTDTPIEPVKLQDIDSLIAEGLGKLPKEIVDHINLQAASIIDADNYSEQAGVEKLTQLLLANMILVNSVIVQMGEDMKTLSTILHGVATILEEDNSDAE